MMVVSRTDSRCALTAPSITCIPSLTQILLVHFASNVYCAFLLIRKRPDNLTLINGQATMFGV
jgi:hypothetical protein